ncbi:sensor histidine kinase [Catenuloplanes japonicus]|uniref:sensor histidine kinase n=1 Tax=Catenuloplanes japonicus TaxID=33876 RepID=UPI00068D6256|nr:sensor histidine kinase [Catenuloplanes japonicus]
MNKDRPWLVSVFFWGCLASVLVLDTVVWQRPGIIRVLIVLLVPAIAGVWLALRWRRGHGRRLATAAFMVLALAICLVDGSPVSLFLLLVALCNITIAFGLWPGVITTTVLVLLQFAAQLWLVDRSLARSAYEAFSIVLYGAFVMALATAVNDAWAAHARADRLHEELTKTHEELRRYAERAHELAVSEERVRMARELHDSVGHHLTVVKVGLENAERWREREPDTAWQDVRQAKTLTGDALQEIRRVVRALRPPQLDGRHGSEALRELAGTFDGTGLDVSLDVDGEERRLDDAREIVLFRALQESLTNALRHSGAHRVAVRLGFAPETVRLSVTDDGRGAGGAGHGFGLTALAGRVRDAGGELHAADVDGGGFRVRVELPA